MIIQFECHRMYSLDTKIEEIVFFLRVSEMMC